MSAEASHYTLWLDCEFTGLSFRDDLLLEVGAIVTEGLFDEVDTYSAFVAQDMSQVAIRMAQDDWWPSRSDHQRHMLEEVEQSLTTVEIVDEALASFAGQYFNGSIVPAGSYPGIDRQFVARDLPRFDALLHYRTIDVSSFKEVAKRNGIQEYQKTEQHRALADACESMCELKYLLKELGTLTTKPGTAT